MRDSSDTANPRDESTEKPHQTEDFDTYEADFACPECGRPLDSQFSYGDHVEYYGCGGDLEGDGYPLTKMTS